MTKEEKRLYEKEYRKKHVDEISLRRKSYYKRDREKQLKLAKLKHGKFKENKVKYENWLEKRRLYNKEYYLKNKDKLLPHNKEYRKKNGAILQYRKTVSGKTAYYASLKDKAIKQATPKWLSKEQKKEIEKIYYTCRKLEKSSGLKYHVDHIYPIRGKYSCGLHVPWNLRIISAEDNLKKNNKEPINFDINKL